MDIFEKIRTFLRLPDPEKNIRIGCSLHGRIFHLTNLTNVRGPGLKRGPVAHPRIAFFSSKNVTERKFWARSARLIHLFFPNFSGAVHVIGDFIATFLGGLGGPRLGLSGGSVGSGSLQSLKLLFNLFIDFSGIIRKSRPRYRRMLCL